MKTEQSSSTSTRDAIRQLPPELVKPLEAALARLRHVLLVRGLLAVGAVALSLLIAVMVIDATMLILSTTVRWLMTIAVLTGTSTAAFFFLYRPFARGWDLKRIARVLETRHPEMQERISSAIELLSDHSSRGAGGSAQLLAELAREAESDARHLVPDDEFTTRKARPFKRILIGAAAILLLALAVWPGPTARLIARAALPTVDLGNAYAGMLSVAPGNKTVPIGESVTISASTTIASVRRVDLLTETSEGELLTERMEAITGNNGTRYVLTFPSLSASVSYRVRAGHAISKRYTITAVARPALKTLTLKHEFPGYTDLPTREEDILSVHEVKALVGSALTLHATFSKPVKSELLDPQRALPAVAADATSTLPAKTWQIPIIADSQVRELQVRLTDKHGFENHPYTIKLIPVQDEPPAIRIEHPVEGELSLSPRSLVTMAYVAHDDFGLSDVAMLVGINGGTPISMPLRLPVQATPESPWLGKAVLDLGTTPQLATARTVTVQLQATDLRPDDFGGHQGGLSRKLTIRIKDNQESLTEQSVAKQEAAIREAIAEADKRLAAAEKLLEKEMKPTLEKKPELTEKLRDSLDEVRQHSAEAESQLKQLADASRESTFARMSPLLEQTAEEEIAPVRQAAEMLQLEDTPEAPAEAVADMAEAVNEAREALAELNTELEKTAEQADYLADLADLAEKQQSLADRATDAETTPETQEALQTELGKEQDGLVSDLAQLTSENPAALRSLLEEQHAEAKQLAAEAADLAKQQQAITKMTAQAKPPEQHSALREQLARQHPEQPADNIDQALANLQEALSEQAANLELRSQQLQEQAKDLAMVPEGEQALERGDQHLQRARQESEAAAQDLREQADQAGETPGAQARALDEQAEAMAEKAKAEKQEARKASSAADAAEREAAAAKGKATKAEQQAAAAAPNEKAKADSQAKAAAQEASQAQKKADAAQKQARTAQKETMAAESLAKQAQEAAHATEQAQEGTAKALEQAAEAFSRAEQQLDRQLKALDAFQAQLAATDMLTEAQLAQESAMETQNATEADDLGTQQDATAAQQAATEAQAMADNAQQEAAQAAADAGMATEQQAAAATAMAEAAAAQEQASQAQATAEAAMQGNKTPAAGEADAAQQQAMQQQEAALAAQAKAQAAQAAATQAMKQAALPMKAERTENVMGMLPGEALAQALQATRRAAAEQTPPAMAQAAQQLEQMAQQAAQAMGAQAMPGAETSDLAQKDEHSQGGDNPQGEDAMLLPDTGDIPPLLRRLGISLADWIRISGWLQSDVAAEANTDIPPEYRGLVRRYFLEVARRGGEQ